jgi:hypothetical protein
MNLKIKNFREREGERTITDLNVKLYVNEGKKLLEEDVFY